MYYGQAPRLGSPMLQAPVKRRNGAFSCTALNAVAVRRNAPRGTAARWLLASGVSAAIHRTRERPFLPPRTNLDLAIPTRDYQVLDESRIATHVEFCCQLRGSGRQRVLATTARPKQ